MQKCKTTAFMDLSFCFQTTFQHKQKGVMLVKDYEV